MLYSSILLIPSLCSLMCLTAATNDSAVPSAECDESTECILYCFSSIDPVKFLFKYPERNPIYLEGSKNFRLKRLNVSVVEARILQPLQDVKYFCILQINGDYLPITRYFQPSACRSGCKALIGIGVAIILISLCGLVGWIVFMGHSERKKKNAKLIKSIECKASPEERQTFNIEDYVAQRSNYTCQAFDCCTNCWSNCLWGIHILGTPPCSESCGYLGKGGTPDNPDEITLAVPDKINTPDIPNDINTPDIPNGINTHAGCVEIYTPAVRNEIDNVTVPAVIFTKVSYEGGIPISQVHASTSDGICKLAFPAEAFRQDVKLGVNAGGIDKSSESGFVSHSSADYTNFKPSHLPLIHSAWKYLINAKVFQYNSFLDYSCIVNVLIKMKDDAVACVAEGKQFPDFNYYLKTFTVLWGEGNIDADSEFNNIRKRWSGDAKEMKSLQERNDRDVNNGHRVRELDVKAIINRIKRDEPGIEKKGAFKNERDNADDVLKCLKHCEERTLTCFGIEENRVFELAYERGPGIPQTEEYKRERLKVFEDIVKLNYEHWDLALDKCLNRNAASNLFYVAAKAHEAEICCQSPTSDGDTNQQLPPDNFSKTPGSYSVRAANSLDPQHILDQIVQPGANSAGGGVDTGISRATDTATSRLNEIDTVNNKCANSDGCQLSNESITSDSASAKYIDLKEDISSYMQTPDYVRHPISVADGSITPSDSITPIDSIPQDDSVLQVIQFLSMGAEEI